MTIQRCVEIPKYECTMTQISFYKWFKLYSTMLWYKGMIFSEKKYDKLCQ